MSWFKSKPQPKEEHPMQEEWDRIALDERPKSYKGIQFPLGRSGFVPPSGPGGIAPINPLQSVSGIFPVMCGDPSLPISPYTGQPYDPAWGVQMSPQGRSNRATLRLMKRLEEQIAAREQEGSVRGPRANPELISEYWC